MPGQGEDLLDHERPADEVADVDAEHRDGRDDRVAERVLREHAPLRQALRARGRDVVRLEHLEQARAQAADQDRRECRARPSAPAGTSSAGGRRTRCRSRRPGTRARGAARRRAAARSRARTAGSRARRAAPRGRRGRARGRACVAAIAASGTAISTAKQRAEADQPERHRQPLEHEVAGRDAVEERVAEVAVHDPAHELPVLHRQRLVEPPLVAEQRDARRRRLVPEDRRAPDRPGTRWIRKKTRIVTPSDDRDQLQEAPRRRSRRGSRPYLASAPSSDHLPSQASSRW